jgi:FkbM family methyltransferase
MQEVIKDEDVFYDIGANFGFYTLFFTSRNQLSLYPFESNRILAERLEKALERTKNNVRIFTVGLSNKSESLFLNQKGNEVQRKIILN